MDLLQSFPYETPRPIQTEVLRELEKNWDEYDIFVIQAPTAFGKTGLARTIQNAFRSVSVITPTNLLVEQYLDEFPDTPTLHRLDSYHCEKWDRPCPITRAKLYQFCSMKRDSCKCPASADLATAKYQKGPGIYNYHTYLAHKLYRDTLVVDEAHNLIPMIRDRLALKIWQHEYRYPNTMWSYEQMLAFIDSLPDKKKKHKKIVEWREAVKFQVPKYIAQRTTEKYNGKGTKRGEPEERDCIKLLPVDISDAPPIMWPREVQKIILMSATIGPKDIEQLGMGNRKILYIKCKSPIPSPARPIVPLDTVSVNYQSMQSGAVEKLANEINKIADFHKGEKGVIHVTYQLATLLRRHLTNDRFIFHDRNSKADQYASFRSSIPEHGMVLVACGMYEGIDLPEDLGRWQVIAKIPWQSLTNPGIKHLSKLDPDWYLWETMKTTIQACGRICRTPEDFGVTYILDSSFHRLFRYGRKMLPEWFVEAVDLQWREDSGYV